MVHRQLLICLAIAGCPSRESNGPSDVSSHQSDPAATVDALNGAPRDGDLAVSAPHNEPDHPPDAPIQPCATVERCEQVLASSTDRDRLMKAGRRLATMGTPEALETLGRHLQQPQFLARLDDLDSGDTTSHLGMVLSGLVEAPIPEVGAMCLALSRDADFVAVEDRKGHLLRALAAVRPMDAPTVAFFAQTNLIGYAPSNAILLGNNASPKALALFEAMMRDPKLEAEDQADAIHRALLPVRTDVNVLTLVTRMLEQKNSLALEISLVETMFDYQPVAWFKMARHRKPPPWADAARAGLELALALARRSQARKRLPAALRRRVVESAKEIRALL